MRCLSASFFLLAGWLAAAFGQTNQLPVGFLAFGPTPPPKFGAPSNQLNGLAIHHGTNRGGISATNLVIAWSNRTSAISDVWISGDLVNWRLHGSVTNSGPVCYLRYVINEPAPCWAKVGNR